MDGEKIKLEEDSKNYILFLLLIFLLMGNQNTFDNYFEILQKEIDKISRILNAITVSSNDLQSVFVTPDKLKVKIKH